MLRQIGLWMMRPWVYRIGCLTLFLAAMYVLRLGLVALRDSGDRTLILEIGIPGIVGLNALGFWLERKGY